MRSALDHDQRVQPCPGTPGENGSAEDASVEDVLVPLPPGLRSIRLSEEAAATMRSVLDDVDRSAFAGQEMPTADASVLQKKAH